MEIRFDWETVLYALGSENLRGKPRVLPEAGQQSRYHFVLQEAAFPAEIKPGVPVRIKFKWLNDGVTYLYEPCHIAAALDQMTRWFSASGWREAILRVGHPMKR